MAIPPDDRPPSEKRGLRIFSFSTHAARGLVRDQTMRRKAMFWTMLLAVIMLFCGATFLAPLLEAHLHPGRFILYWLACAWVTITAVLLAIFDLLLVRAQARTERRELAHKLTEADSPNDED